MGMNVFRIMAPAATGFIIDAWDFAAAYYERSFVFYAEGSYMKAWKDIQKAEHYGYRTNPEYRKKLYGIITGAGSRQTGR